MTIVEYFYVLVMDEDDNVVHREKFETLFPSAHDVANILRQVATTRKDDPTKYTGKIDKRTGVTE